MSNQYKATLIVIGKCILKPMEVIESIDTKLYLIMNKFDSNIVAISYMPIHD